MRGMEVHDFVLYWLENSNIYIRNIEDYKNAMKDIVNDAQMEQIDYYLLEDVCTSVDYFNTFEECFDFTQ